MAKDIRPITKEERKMGNAIYPTAEIDTDSFTCDPGLVKALATSFKSYGCIMKVNATYNPETFECRANDRIAATIVQAAMVAEIESLLICDVPSHEYVKQLKLILAAK